MQRIYNILVSIMGESKQGGYDKGTTQYQFNCPYCADEKGGIDNKYNMEVSFSLGKFHCWSCNSSGPISRLIRARGGKELVEEYFRLIKEIKEAKFYDLELFKDNGEIFSETYLRLPETFRKIDIKTCKDKALIKFLAKRKITQDIIDYYNIGYTTWDESDWSWRNRIVFPSYNSMGDLNYYVGRSYKDNDTRNKYKNCDADKFEIILHEDKIQWDADIYLVEGVIDALVAPNLVSLMGKSLNKSCQLYNSILEKSNARIIIVLDGDTNIDETKRIYRLLNRGRLRGRICYINLQKDSIYKDLSEIYENEGKNGIINIMKKTKQFSEIDLIY